MEGKSIVVRMIGRRVVIGNVTGGVERRSGWERSMEGVQREEKIGQTYRGETQCDVSFSCVVKTQKRWSNKIYKTELTKIR